MEKNRKLDHFCSQIQLFKVCFFCHLKNNVVQSRKLCSLKKFYRVEIVLITKEQDVFLHLLSPLLPLSVLCLLPTEEVPI